MKSDDLTGLVIVLVRLALLVLIAIDRFKGERVLIGDRKAISDAEEDSTAAERLCASACTGTGQYRPARSSSRKTGSVHRSKNASSRAGSISA